MYCIKKGERTGFLWGVARVQYDCMLGMVVIKSSSVTRDKQVNTLLRSLDVTMRQEGAQEYFTKVNNMIRLIV